MFGNASDLRPTIAIVAGKPTNTAGATAAEPVEPRAGTKGNADQQSTRRAQDRASVSQALESIRQVAKQREKERFTSLLHHIKTSCTGRGRSPVMADSSRSSQHICLAKHSFTA